MDRDELVRLAGEQALLRQELRELAAQHNRDKLLLQNLHNDVDRTANWLDGGADDEFVAVGEVHVAGSVNQCR